MAFLLDNLPPQVTVAMTTRADPPLPLSRLRARGELLEIRGRAPGNRLPNHLLAAGSATTSAQPVGSAGLGGH